MSRKNNYVEVLLRGGLGNQLFQFFSGLNLALINKAELRLNLTLLDHSKHMNSLITDLNIFQGNKVIDFRIIKNRPNFIPRFIHNFYWTRIVHHIRRANYFLSNEVGWDPKLLEMKLPLLINSYSQSYKHLLNCSQHGGLISVRPKKINLEVNSVRDLLESDNTFVIHIRRGDYLSDENINSIGALEFEYFNKALKRIKFDPIKNSLVIFTDLSDLNLVLSDFPLTNYQVFGPESDFSAAEVLYLMSICKNLIISNSTLSLVAALLNSELVNVVAPKKWFKNLPNPNFLFPENWISEESRWIG